MPRAGFTHVLANPVADAHQQLSTATEQTITLPASCSAVMLAGRSGTGPISVTFDNSAASATNGLPVVVGANPVIIPLGYYAHVDHKLRALGGASSVLDVLLLA